MTSMVRHAERISLIPLRYPRSEAGRATPKRSGVTGPPPRPDWGEKTLNRQNGHIIPECLTASGRDLNP